VSPSWRDSAHALRPLSTRPVRCGKRQRHLWLEIFTSRFMSYTARPSESHIWPLLTRPLGMPCITGFGVDGHPSGHRSSCSGDRTAKTCARRVGVMRTATIRPGDRVEHRLGAYRGETPLWGLDRMMRLTCYERVGEHSTLLLSPDIDLPPVLIAPPPQIHLRILSQRHHSWTRSALGRSRRFFALLGREDGKWAERHSILDGLGL
jgi:hypothetical protein